MQRVGKHPYTTSIHDAFNDDGNFYLIMDLCTGGELFDQIAKKVRLKSPFKMFVWYYACSIARHPSTLPIILSKLVHKPISGNQS